MYYVLPYGVDGRIYTGGAHIIVPDLIIVPVDRMGPGKPIYLFRGPPDTYNCSGGPTGPWGPWAPRGPRAHGGHGAPWGRWGPWDACGPWAHGTHGAHGPMAPMGPMGPKPGGGRRPAGRRPAAGGGGGGRRSRAPEHTAEQQNGSQPYIYTYIIYMDFLSFLLIFLNLVFHGCWECLI